MKLRNRTRFMCRLLTVLLSASVATGCSLKSRDEEREERIAGVAVPIPRGMNKSTEQKVELKLPGLGGAHVSYRGNVDPREIVSFYEREMPSRGWSPKGSLVAEGGALAYTRDNRSLLIRIGRSEGYTTLAILVGALGS